jgi:alpha-tubulin suppressor-like RCC1 family protein
LTHRGALGWGDNLEGQLGDGTQANRASPVQTVGMYEGVNQVDAGGGHTLAVLDTGTVMAWGSNSAGQLGDGTFVYHFVPVTVPGLTSVKQVAAGGRHSLALRSDGTVWAWGANTDGQLGDGTNNVRTTPVRVQGLTAVTQVAAGENFSLALRSDGTVWAWGDNEYGQLGDATVADRVLPGAALGLTGVTQVAAGGWHSLALRSNGVAYAWGNNSSAQLGDGTSISHYLPLPVTVLTGITQVAGGGGFTVALRGGVAYSWGVLCFEASEDTGLCGGGPRPTAQPIHSKAIVQVAAGGNHGLALDSDGVVWSWGSNFYGQIGDGTNIHRPTPVRVTGLDRAVQVDGGKDHTAVVAVKPLVLHP